MKCPRCQRESVAHAAYCGGCGAPLRLGDELPPARLDVPLDLDRRKDPAGAPRDPEAPAPARERAAAELAALERSDWDIGRGAEEPPSRPRADEGVPDAEVDALEIHVERGASWRRAAAWLVDVVPFAVAGGALGRALLREARPDLSASVGLGELLDVAAREQVIVLSLCAAVTLALAAYATLAHALAGATLGKWIFGLRVVGPDGARPSPGRSAARSALAVVSAALLGLGFLLALFTRSGRAAHDLVARTWVVKAP